VIRLSPRVPPRNFCEYYAELDCILEDQLWKPSVVDGARGLYNWVPPLPTSLMRPDALRVGA
jgi:hypothetical protein